MIVAQGAPTLRRLDRFAAREFSDHVQLREVDDLEMLEGSRFAGSISDDSLFRLLVETVEDYAIFLLDTRGYVISWNAGAERIKGYRANEIIGRHFSTFYSKEDLDAEKPDMELVMALQSGRWEDEGWRIRKDGTRFWANVIISTLFDRSGRHIGFAKVTRDLTERRKAEDERLRLTTMEREAQARAEVTQRALVERDAFLSVAAHELKTPVTSLRGFAQLALRELRTDDGEPNYDRVIRALRVIDDQSKKLTHLIGRLLDLSRVESGQLTVGIEKMDLVSVVRNAQDAVRFNDDTRQFRLTAPDFVTMQGDPLRLEQVFVNLLDNAVRYSPSGTPITVTVRVRENNMVQVAVADRGPGVPPEYRDRIFDRFQQASESSAVGLGLGLYISREIVQLHGGTIQAVFPTAGGSRFVVTLPLALDRSRSRTAVQNGAADQLPRNGVNSRTSGRASQPKVHQPEPNR